MRASLIVVYTHTGQTAEMVAKYRPPMPILTLVVPHLISNTLKWNVEGRCVGVVGGKRVSQACKGARILPLLGVV